MSNESFSKWMSKQIRLAGEELIRRAGQINFEGWDMVTRISIDVDIPTYNEDIECPSISFNFDCLNKTTIDDLVNSSVPLEHVIADKDEHRSVADQFHIQTEIEEDYA